MSLKSGRVGVNPAFVNPVDGSILLPPSPPPENVYTKTECDNKFLSKTDASSTYLSKTDASSTYLTQTSAGNTYQTKTASDSWVADTATVSSDSFTFTGLDDTQGWGYDPYVVVTDSSTEKNPYATIDTITGSGTANMSIVYSTNADAGATVKLRIIK